MHTHSHTYTYTYTYTHAHSHTYTCMHTYSHSHTHTYTYTHTHACTHEWDIMIWLRNVHGVQIVRFRQTYVSILSSRRSMEALVLCPGFMWREISKRHYNRIKKLIGYSVTGLMILIVMFKYPSFLLKPNAQWWGWDDAEAKISTDSYATVRTSWYVLKFILPSCTPSPNFFCSFSVFKDEGLTRQRDKRGKVVVKTELGGVNIYVSMRLKKKVEYREVKS